MEKKRKKNTIGTSIQQEKLVPLFIAHIIVVISRYNKAKANHNSNSERFDARKEQANCMVKYMFLKNEKLSSISFIINSPTLPQPMLQQCPSLSHRAVGS